MVYFFSNLMSFLLEKRKHFSHKVLVFFFLSPRAKLSEIKDFYGFGVYSWIVTICNQARIFMFYSRKTKSIVKSYNYASIFNNIYFCSKVPLKIFLRFLSFTDGRSFFSKATLVVHPHLDWTFGERNMYFVGACLEFSSVFFAGLRSIFPPSSLPESTTEKYISFHK